MGKARSQRAGRTSKSSKKASRSSSKPKARLPQSIPRGVCLGPPPATPDELHVWIQSTLNYRIARTPLIPGHAAPFDYLCHSYFEGEFRGTGVPPVSCSSASSSSLPLPPASSPDCIVWANRGGGKTFLGAIATLLDLLFKPRCQVRILAGSVEQGKRMHEHLRDLLDAEPLAHLSTRITNRRIAIRDTKAAVEILAASQTSIRGTRIQKLRCDEVDLFDEDVWSAAQLVTRSIPCDPSPWGATIRGSVEALSTMHRPYGMMWTLVGDPARYASQTGDSPLSTIRKAEEPPQSEVCNIALPQLPSAPGRLNNSESNSISPSSSASLSALGVLGGEHSSSALQRPHRTLFRWGLLDVLERCSADRSCDSCPLYDECQGRAKLTPPEHAGHIGIDDAALMKLRVSRAVWESEMLCLRPSRSNSVYPEFDPRLYIRGGETPPSSLAELLADFPPFTCMIGGVDFGFRSESALLLAGITREGVVCIVREHCKRELTIDQQLDELDAWRSLGLVRRRTEPGHEPPLEFLGVDPAGNARDQQTGITSTGIINARGYPPKHRKSSIAEGLGVVKRRIAPAFAPPRALFAPALFRTGIGGEPGRVLAGPGLLIHASCTRLIECLTHYHYDEKKPDCPDPVKDGFDHACDALRYMLVNLDMPHQSAAYDSLHGNTRLR